VIRKINVRKKFNAGAITATAEKQLFAQKHFTQHIHCVPKKLDHQTHRWRGGATGTALDFAISRSRVQILLEATLRNDLRQVVHTYVPLSPCSITWFPAKRR